MVMEGRTPVFGSKREEAGFTLVELLIKGAGGNCVRSEAAQRVGLDTSSFNTHSPARGIGHEEAFPAPDAGSGQPGRAPPG
jgi:hypothetical protein